VGGGARKRGYVQLWFLARSITTAAEGGAALGLALDERSSQVGGWGGCRADYVSTSDIMRAVKVWDEPAFRQEVRRMLGMQHDPRHDTPPPILGLVNEQPLILEDNGQQAGGRDPEPDHWNAEEFIPAQDDSNDMDWQPTPGDYQTSSSSSEGEDRPHRVFGRRRQAQAPGIPPPLRDEPQAARQVIEVVIPVRQQVPPAADVAPGQDVAQDKMWMPSMNNRSDRSRRR
jgi:hypothetical protein